MSRCLWQLKTFSVCSPLSCIPGHTLLPLKTRCTIPLGRCSARARSSLLQVRQRILQQRLGWLLRALQVLSKWTASKWSMWIQRTVHVCAPIFCLATALVSFTGYWYLIIGKEGILIKGRDNVLVPLVHWTPPCYREITLLRRNRGLVLHCFPSSWTLTV